MDNLLRSIIRGNPNNPESNLSNPANWLLDWIGGSGTKAGIDVTPDAALGLPAMWRAVSLWSKTIGALPLHVYTEKNGNKVVDKKHPTYNLLHNKPNDKMTSYIWRLTSMIHVLLWGNSYSLIEFNGAVRPISLMPFHPRDVDVKIDDNGKIWYVFKQPNGETIIVDSSQVLHIKGFTTDGITGKSLISALKENIGLGLAAQEFGASFYKKGAKLDGVIEMEKTLGKSGIGNLRQTWKDTYAGNDGERLAILDAGMKYKTIGIPPEDSQYIETRKFSVTDVARITDIPPPLLYDLERSTFANIQKLIESFVKFSLTPWLINWEQEINDKLFFNNEKNVTFAQFNVDGLLRGDVKARYEAYQKAIQNGIMTPNQAASKENLPTYPEGNQHFMPMNIQPIGTPKTNGQGTKKDVEIITN
ncbi:MAG: phage portal protein [Candidatus Anammoxibacter sp.]